MKTLRTRIMELQTRLPRHSPIPMDLRGLSVEQLRALASIKVFGDEAGKETVDLAGLTDEQQQHLRSINPADLKPANL